MSNLSIGIDLGTTYSCISFIQNGNIDIIEDEFGNPTFPSIVSFKNGKIECGYNAKYGILTNPQNTICNIKRIIGIPYDDINEDEKKKYMGKLEKNPKNNFPLININDNNENKKYSPEEICSWIFKYIKKLIEKSINEIIINEVDIVLTVPANFNYFQINATKNAAKSAGFNIIRIIKEPTAAAITYLYLKKEIDIKKIIIFDFGGGTLDISIADINQNNIEIVFTKGENYLGGENFDDKLVEYCAQNILEKSGLDVHNNQKALIKLKIACENAKIDLSYMRETMIDIDNLMNGINFQLHIDRTTFEFLCDDLFNEAINILKNSLKEAKLNINDISNIILVGGSSKIPKIREEIYGIFKKKFKRNDLLIEQIDNIEEYIAKGAAIQHAIIKQIKNMNIKFYVLDIYPKSIGIKLNQNKIHKLIPYHSPIPVETNYKYCTTVDFIEKMNFSILEGDNNDNFKKIYHLTKKIPSKPKGKVIINLSIRIDINSCLSIEIKDNFSSDIIRKIINIENVHQFEKNYKFDENNYITEKINEIKSLEKNLTIINEEEEKIKKLKKLISLYIEYLKQIDINIDENQTYEKDFLLYLKNLINKYNELFQINNTMINLKDDFQKIEDLLDRVKPSQIIQLIPDLRKLEIFNEIYFNFIINMILKLKIGCIQSYLDNKNLANYLLNIIYKISDELLKNQLSKYTSLKNNYNNIINECKFYERRIQASKIIEVGDKKYKELVNQNLNEESYQTINKIFNNALNIVYNNKNNIKDEDYAIIIVIRIMIIQYKSKNITEERFLNNYLKLSLLEKKEKNHLFDKNENKVWFNELIKIIEEIKLINQIDSEYEINLNNNTYLNFIKFILNTFPCENNITSENLETEYNRAPINLVRDIRNMYFPQKNQNTENNFKIFNKITCKLNDLINKLNHPNEIQLNASIEL